MWKKSKVWSVSILTAWSFLGGIVARAEDPEMLVSTPDTQPVWNLLVRQFGDTALQNVDLNLIDQASKIPEYSYVVESNKVSITANTPVALAHGFYDVMKKQGAGIVSWSGSRLVWPEKLTPMNATVASPVSHHYYLNVVTYGYTMSYWDWARWEQEIDWMALHGIDMPLALVGTEAAAVQTWRRIGLADTEFASFYTGPAHLPWHRMGNLIQHDGPLPESWHVGQIALQKQILARMRELGMTPIAPAFSGVVPAAVTRVFPDAKLHKMAWGGFPESKGASLLDPGAACFVDIGKIYAEEWEKLFGANTYFLADLFNEMELPVTANPEETRKLLASYGETAYRSLTAHNPNAVWVMQGWMLGYNRKIWTPENLAALLSKVPDDRMIILDLATDYNRHFWKNGMNWNHFPKFFGKQWIYSVIPNMGGKTLPTGVLEYYANGHLEALKSANRGNLVGLGLAPEGIENNEMIYELYTDVIWGDAKTDLSDWLKNYAQNRYGSTDAVLLGALEGFRKSVYSEFTDHPRFNWQFTPIEIRKPQTHYAPEFFKAVEDFASLSDRLGNNPLYVADLAFYTAVYLGAKAEPLLSQSADYYNNKGSGPVNARVNELMTRFQNYLYMADYVLSTHPNLNLQRWLDYPKKHSDERKVWRAYEKNARRLITLWGPPINDYSARLWGGLIRDYYIIRCMQWQGNIAGVFARDVRKDEDLWIMQSNLNDPQNPLDKTSVFNSQMSTIEACRAALDYAKSESKN